jgi:hypothetical protein
MLPNGEVVTKNFKENLTVNMINACLSEGVHSVERLSKFNELYAELKSGKKLTILDKTFEKSPMNRVAPAKSKIEKRKEKQEHKKEVKQEPKTSVFQAKIDDESNPFVSTFDAFNQLQQNLIVGIKADNSIPKEYAEAFAEVTQNLFDEISPSLVKYVENLLKVGLEHDLLSLDEIKAYRKAYNKAIMEQTGDRKLLLVFKTDKKETEVPVVEVPKVEKEEELPEEPKQPEVPQQTTDNTAVLKGTIKSMVREEIKGFRNEIKNEIKPLRDGLKEIKSLKNGMKDLQNTLNNLIDQLTAPEEEELPIEEPEVELPIEEPDVKAEEPKQEDETEKPLTAKQRKELRKQQEEERLALEAEAAKNLNEGASK